MAKQKLKKIEPRIRQKELGLKKNKKKFASCSFRIAISDRKELAEIADSMDAFSSHKKIGMTDALRAMIHYCSDIDPENLLDSLGRAL